MHTLLFLLRLILLFFNGTYTSNVLKSGQKFLKPAFNENAAGDGMILGTGDSAHGGWKPGGWLFFLIEEERRKHEAHSQ